MPVLFLQFHLSVYECNLQLQIQFVSNPLKAVQELLYLVVVICLQMDLKIFFFIDVSK